MSPSRFRGLRASVDVFMGLGAALAVALVAITFFALFPWSTEAEQNRLLTEKLRVVRPETAAEQAAADEAERRPPVEVPGGFWRSEYRMTGWFGGRAYAEGDMVLTPGTVEGSPNLFTFTATFRHGARIGVQETVRGTYTVMGACLHFTVDDGEARGLFTEGGRVPVRAASPGRIEVTMNDGSTLVYHRAG